MYVRKLFVIFHQVKMVQEKHEYFSIRSSRMFRVCFDWKIGIGNTSRILESLSEDFPQMTRALRVSLGRNSEVSLCTKCGQPWFF